MRQVRIVLRGGDIDAVAEDPAVQDDPIGYHEDAERSRMTREDIRGAVGDDADGPVRTALRCGGGGRPCPISAHGRPPHPRPAPRRSHPRGMRAAHHESWPTVQ